MTNTSLPLYLKSALELATLIRTGEVTSVELTKLFIERIKQYAALNAFTTVATERAMAMAENADRLLKAGVTLSPLHGVPIALKEHFQWAGTTAHYGSQARLHDLSTQNSRVIEQIASLGMVLLGKTAMTEFAFGLSGQNPTVGTPVNPWHPTEHRAPGGSSSGAGVAVSAGLVPLVIGGDTGGSVRAPASLNHVVGFKPSDGVISRTGCMPLCETLDVLGPLAHTVEDVRCITSLLAQADNADSATLTPEALQCQRDFHASSLQMSHDKTVYVLDEAAWPHGLAADARVDWDNTLTSLARKGWQLMTWAPSELAFIGEAGRLNSVILAYEAYQTQGHYAEDAANGMWSVVRTRIANGKNISAEDYVHVLQTQHAYRQRFAAEFPQEAVLMMPAINQGAQKMDAQDATHVGLGNWLRPANFLGLPAISLPSGCDSEGMPLGIQLLARQYQDVVLLQKAALLEKDLGDTRRLPGRIT